MPRLFSSLAFTGISVVLAASVYAWRARELQSLQQQLAENVRLAAQPVQEESPSLALLRQIKTLRSEISADPEKQPWLQLLQSLTPAQLDAFCGAVMKEPLPASVQQTVLAAIAKATASCSDSEALAILLKICPKHGDSRRLFEKRAGKWIQANQAEAVAWIAPHLKDGTMNHLRESFREKLNMVVEFSPAILEPASHLEKLREAPEPVRGGLLAEGMRNAKTPADRRTIAAAALTWPATDSLRGRAAEMMPLLAQADGFEETARWLNGLENLDERGTDARVVLATHTPGYPDIGKNADLLLQQTEDRTAAAFAGKLVSTWIRQDHRAAAEWINAHPGTVWQDEARKAFAQGIASSEPADGMTWAASISEPSLRREIAEDIFVRWKAKDSSAAGAFLTGPSLPDDLKQSLGH